MERPSPFRTLEGEMIDVVVLAAVLAGMFCVLVACRYGIYRLQCRWEWNQDDGFVVRPFRCFYGYHSWYIDDEVFSWVRRCHRCPEVEDKLALRRLEYERKLWGGDIQVRNAAPWAAREHVQAMLREWDRENHFFHMEAVN